MLIKQAEDNNSKHPLPDNWYDLITSHHRDAIPVGPRFQTEVPDYKGNDSESLELYVGTKIWPPMRVAGKKILKIDEIEEGRSDICSCKFRGSIKCVMKHVEDEKTKMQTELGPVFWEWKFNEIGEGYAKLWTEEEQKIFESIMKNRPTKGVDFLKPALESLPSQTRKSIINYYLSVYIPRQIRMKTRISEIFDTDNDVPWVIVGAGGEILKSKVSKKRRRTRSSTPKASPAKKTRRPRSSTPKASPAKKTKRPRSSTPKASPAKKKVKY